MNMDTRVIKVADFKFEVKRPPKPFDVMEHHMPISHSPCRRRYIGPLPSCFPRPSLLKNMKFFASLFSVNFIKIPNFSYVLVKYENILFFLWLGWPSLNHGAR